MCLLRLSRIVFFGKEGITHDTTGTWWLLRIYFSLSLCACPTHVVACLRPQVTVTLLFRNLQCVTLRAILTSIFFCWEFLVTYCKRGRKRNQQNSLSSRGKVCRTRIVSCLTGCRCRSEVPMIEVSRKALVWWPRDKASPTHTKSQGEGSSEEGRWAWREEARRPG